MGEPVTWSRRLDEEVNDNGERRSMWGEITATA